MKNKRLLSAGLAMTIAAMTVFTGCADATMTADDFSGESRQTEATADSGDDAGSEAGDTDKTSEEDAGNATETETSSVDNGESTNAGADSGSDFSETGTTNASIEEAPEIAGLTCESVMPLDYAISFNVFYYNDDYKVIDVPESGTYLLVPEGAETPEDLSDDITVLQQPLDRIYLVATAAMSLFYAIDGQDAIKMTGTDASGWYIDGPGEDIENGNILYAGKYSEPDYEMLISNDCDIAIESTMILHSPSVQEMLEDLDIPVFIDRASYETHPLGRTEWIKVYGAMLNKEDAAKKVFDEKKSLISELEDFENTGKTIAYFSINTNNQVVVRTLNDYVPAMIDLAGGEYIFKDLVEGQTSSTMNLSTEEFYNTAVDADYIVYNATISDVVSNVDELIEMESLIGECKAVQEGNVWQVDRRAYQSTDNIANMIMDFHLMLTDGDESQMTFLSRIE